MKDLENKLDTFLKTFEDKLVEERKTNEDLTDKKIDAHKADVKKEIDDLLAAYRKNNVELGLDKKDADKFSFAKAAFGVINNNWENAGYEQEVFKETGKKAVDTNTGGQGGYLIPIELAQEKLIKPAIANTVLKAAGTTFWTGLTADLDIPRATSRPTLSWTADGQALTAQDISFGMEKLRPKEGGMLVKVSNRLLMQSPQVAEQIVRDLMMEGITIGLDNIGLNGTGSDSQPKGILNYTFTNTKAIGDARLTIDDVAAMGATIEEQNFLKTGGGTLITRPIVKSGLKREQVAMFSGDTGGMPILNPWMSDRVLEDTLGMKILTTTNIAVATAQTKAILGEFKHFAMGVWGGMRLKSSDVAGTAFATNQTWLVAFVDVDSVMMQEKAFNLASGIETDF